MKTIAVLLAAALAAAPSFAGFVFTTECSDGDWGAYEEYIRTPLCPRFGWDPRFGPDHDDPTIFITTDNGKNFTFHGFTTGDSFQVRSSKGGFLITDGVAWETTADWLFVDLGPLWQNIEWASVLLPNSYDSYSYQQVTLINLHLAENTCEDPKAPGCTLLAAISEPGTLTLLAIGFSGLVGLGWHRRWQAKQPV